MPTPTLRRMPIAGALQRGWARYGALLEHYPIRTKAVTACVIFTTADITRQAIEHRNTNQNQHASGSAGSDSGEPSSPRPAQPGLSLAVVHSPHPAPAGARNSSRLFLSAHVATDHN